MASSSFGLEARGAALAGAALMAEAGDEMIVDEASRLHEGIDDGRADEFEAARRQLLGNLDRERRGGGHACRGLELVDLRLAVDEVPQEFREAGAFVHDLQIG